VSLPLTDNGTPTFLYHTKTYDFHLDSSLAAVWVLLTTLAHDADLSDEERAIILLTILIIILIKHTH